MYQKSPEKKWCQQCAWNSMQSIISIFSMGKRQLRPKLDWGISVKIMGTYKWHRCFSQGIFYFMDPERSEISRLYKDSTESHIHDLITTDRCLRIREVRSMCGICISKFSVFIILTEDFDMCWICARWLPRILSDYHKKDKCRQVKI